MAFDLGDFVEIRGKLGFILVLIIALPVVWLFLKSEPADGNDPPLQQQEVSFPTGTPMYLIPDVIKPEDKSLYEGKQYVDRMERKVYDKRQKEPYVNINAFIYDAYFSDNHSIEIQVNPEFQDTATASKEVDKYARLLGQLPAFLRKGVRSISIHKGDSTLTGFSGQITIHTAAAEDWESSNVLEETMLHESIHAVLDEKYKETEAWKRAQQTDNRFISRYAKDYPDREDMAESFLFYLAAQHRSERVDAILMDSILVAIPNRIAFFNDLQLDMYPID